jgi:hypothetical protein
MMTANPELERVAL